jgi:hypothetical protein
MAQLHAPMQRGEFTVAGRLIEHRIALHRLRKRLGIGIFPDVEGVEAGAQHEHELVAQHLAGRAQFAAIMVTLAQQAGLAVGAAVAEGRKHQRHRSDAVEIGHEVVDVAAVRPDHADLATLQQRLGILEKARGRDQHATLRQLRTIGDMREGIADNLSALNEWHRRAP